SQGDGNSRSARACDSLRLTAKFRASNRLNTSTLACAERTERSRSIGARDRFFLSPLRTLSLRHPCPDANAWRSKPGLCSSDFSFQLFIPSSEAEIRSPPESGRKDPPRSGHRPRNRAPMVGRFGHLESVPRPVASGGAGELQLDDVAGIAGSGPVPGRDAEVSRGAAVKKQAG